MGRERAGNIEAQVLVASTGCPAAVADQAVLEAERSVTASRALHALLEVLERPEAPDAAAEQLARIALRLLTGGPEQFACALVHGYAARSIDQVELVDLAVSSGRLALAAGDHVSARLLLRGALDLDEDGHLADRPRLLFDLARAVDGCGDLAEARDLLSECVRLARAAGDPQLVADAAVRSAFPPDWRAGDRRRTALLALAEEMDTDGERAAAILAARAMLEMRIPAPGDPSQQIAWVTRGAVAQPLADRALHLSKQSRPEDRLVALLAWRSTHRSPDLLGPRRAASTEAVDLAQRLLDHDRLVDAGVVAAVDRLEAGDRAAYDRALTTVQWAARADGNPRLRWWAETLSAGAALLDGDLDRAAGARAAAYEAGERHQLPGWVAAELLLAAETALLVDDPDELPRYCLPDDSPVLASPLARASVALAFARMGQPGVAVRHAHVVHRALDLEASYLLCLTLLARTAILADDAELMGSCREKLVPYSGRVAVDASGWWCIGPVDLTLGEVELALGQVNVARSRVGPSQVLARALGDGASTARVDALRAAVADRSARGERRLTAADVAPRLELLSERERSVLRLIARGHTNAAIGAALAYSQSTIRADTVSIYRKLDVGGRAEAAALAVMAGLTDEPD